VGRIGGGVGTGTGGTLGVGKIGGGVATGTGGTLGVGKIGGGCRAPVGGALGTGTTNDGSGGEVALAGSGAPGGATSGRRAVFTVPWDGDPRFERRV
jgi:hypothetical protein